MAARCNRSRSTCLETPDLGMNDVTLSVGCGVQLEVKIRLRWEHRSFKIRVSLVETRF